MDIFEDAKARKFFIEVSEGLDERTGDRAWWTRFVKTAFLDKVTSDEDLVSYKLTVEDLGKLLEKFSNRNKQLL